MTGESTVFGATIFKYFDSKCKKRLTVTVKNLFRQKTATD
jgi:hypothetical protein